MKCGTKALVIHAVTTHTNMPWIVKRHVAYGGKQHHFFCYPETISPMCCPITTPGLITTYICLPKSKEITFATDISTIIAFNIINLINDL